MSTDPVCHPTITAYFDATRRMDQAAWVGCFATDAESHDPVGAPPIRGHAALGQFFAGIVGLVESIALWEDLVSGSGNELAVTWTMVGRGKNGRAFRFRGVDVFQLDARGKIRSLRGYWPAGELVTLLTT